MSEIVRDCPRLSEIAPLGGGRARLATVLAARCLRGACTVTRLPSAGPAASRPSRGPSAHSAIDGRRRARRGARLSEVIRVLLETRHGRAQRQAAYGSVVVLAPERALRRGRGPGREVRKDAYRGLPDGVVPALHPLPRAGPLRLRGDPGALRPLPPYYHLTVIIVHSVSVCFSCTVQAPESTDNPSRALREHTTEKEKTSHLYRRERHHDWDGVVRRRRPRAAAALSAHAEAAPPAAPPPEGRTEHDEQRASRAACSQRGA